MLRLDVETGALYWRISLGSRAQAGQRAGSFHHQHSGYRFVVIDGRKYREHVVIWFMLYGEWLPRKIDHKDRDRANNRPINLRKADEAEQRSNAKLRSDNHLGERGVSFHPASGFYYAEAKRGPVRLRKCFHSIPEAVACAKAFRKELFGEFAPARDSHRGQ